MKRKKRYEFFILILVLAIGFAAVSTNLIINGNSLFGTNEDDFKIVFTKSVIDGIDVSESTISEDGASLTFTTSELAIMNDTSVLDFEVTNNSTQYDASVTMECVSEGEKANTYYKVESDLPEVISAASKENGNVTVTLLKTSVDEIEETFTCTISATAIERETAGVMYKTYTLGEEITLAEEKFNVISQTEDTVTMLAKNNLGTDYKQTKVANTVKFSNSGGWEYTPGPKEIDIQIWSTIPKKYINEYVTYLQEETKDSSITGNLITLSELKILGCTINDNYSYTDGLTCANSDNASWLVNGQTWWTRSAYVSSADYVWRMDIDGTLYHNSGPIRDFGVRPVITISKSQI